MIHGSYNIKFSKHYLLSHHMYTSTCNIIRYNNAQTCGNHPLCFGLCRLFSGHYSINKNTIMGIYLHMTYRQILFTITSAQRKSYKNSMCKINTLLAIIVFFFVEYHPEDSRQGSKHVGGLPHVGALLYVIKLS